MKKFFRLVSTLAVAGLAFAYTGCTDYSEDVNRLDERIDGHIATTEEQYKKLEEADDKLQKEIDAANASIKSLQDNTASLKEELTALATKHDADIKAVKEAHAADKAAIEKTLADKAQELTDALTALDTKYAGEISKLAEAYKQADTELKNQILQNGEKITALQSDVKNITEVVIPAVQKQITDLAAAADATYATKVELTNATAEVVALVNEKTSALETRLADVEKRLEELSTAHNALKEDFDATKAAHAASLAELNTKLAALEKTHGSDIEEVKGLIATANEAIEAAQTAADAAAAAAKKAQETADKAVAAAAAAAAAAKAAQETANDALGKVDALIEALGVYAAKGALEAKIADLVAADAALVAKDAELAAADVELAKKYAELAAKDEEFAGLIKALQVADTELGNKIDQVAEDADKALADAKKQIFNEIAKLNETLQGYVKELFAADEAMAKDIEKLFNEKFNSADFAETFKTAYEARFQDDFDGAFTKAWTETFQPAFNTAFETAWGTNFQPAFDTAFGTAWETNFQSSFNTAFETAIAGAIADNGVVSEAILEKVNAAKTDLINNKIKPLEDKVDAAVTRIDDTIGDIILVIGDLANRIQSVTFVPEYDDMCASLYYYYIYNDKAGKSYPLSDKTVVASFEVYPRTQAEDVAKMLESGEASIVAVPLKHHFTRGAAEAATATIKSAVAANGIVKVEAVFGEGVDYELPEYPSGTPVISSAADHASSFAIALRVEAPAETEINTVDEEGNAKVEKKDAGKYIESAYVPVRLSAGCELTDAFTIYDFTNEVKLIDNSKIQKEWSDAPAVWNYFKGYDYAVYIADFRKGETFEDAKYRTIADAAAIMNVDPAKITPAMTVAAAADPKANAKFFSKVDFEMTLAAAYISMNETEVLSNPKAAVGSHMTHTANFSLAGVKNVIPVKTADYEIIRRKVTFDVTPYDVNRIDWSYKKAKELTKNIASGVAYDKDITFDECYVTKKESDESKYAEKYPETVVSLGDILKLKPTYKVTSTINDKTVDVPVTKTPIQITKVADKVEDVAKVVIKGRTYNFSQVGDNKYVVEAIYAVDENQTDYIINFEYVLGKMAEDQIVTLPAKAFKFNSKDPSFKVTYDVDEYRKPLVDAIGGYFADAKTLWASVNEEKVVKTQKVNAVIDGKKDDSFPATSVTTINVTDDGVNVVVDRADLKTFEDTFSYEATRKTWYGVTYTFKTANALAFVKPDFRLAPAKDRLNEDWTGTILHEAKYDKYVLKQDIDLSKYVIVDNYDGKEETLTIEYAQKTKADAVNGIENVPSIATATVKVIPNAASPAFPTIEESLINWLKNPRADSFTARYDEITAVLKFDGIKLDEKVMKLSTARPITKFAFDKVEKVVPVGSTGETVNLWNNMIIEGVLEEGNIVKQDAKSLTGVFVSTGTVKGKKTNPYTYDCEVIFPKTEDVEVYVGGEKQKIYNYTKFKYDQEKGIIILTGDLSDLVKPIEFRFKAKLNYVLDYVHHDQLEAEVSVTFKK